MKILLSAFACIPNVGSEGGVGWRWAHEWARDHDVVVITDVSRRSAIEAELAVHPMSNPRFVYFRPWWLRWMPLNSYTAQVLYQLWQVSLLPFVRQLHARERFDLAHHATYCVFRQPSLIGHAGIPLVFGPVGGGEDAPWRLKQSMRVAERVREALRSFLNHLARFDPLLRWGLKGCSLVLAKTEATARALPKGFAERTKVTLEIGTEPREGVVPRKAAIGRPLRLLYAGNLIGLKGIHLALGALALAHARGVDLIFHIAGSGPLEGKLRRQAESLGIGEFVHWAGRLSQKELFDQYRMQDALIFPSLHDSTGHVVLEALSFALPVICLDLGGPADIVNDECGYKVRTAGLDEEAVMEHMADAVVRMATVAKYYEQLSAGALKRSGELDWNRQAAHIKALALECLA